MLWRSAKRISMVVPRFTVLYRSMAGGGGGGGGGPDGGH
jgi:hypothetical protein